MEVFTIGSETIEFDNEFEILNTLRAEIMQASGQSSFLGLLNGMLEKYGADNLGEVIIKDFPTMVNTGLCEGLVPTIIDFLFNQGIYDCDEQAFIQKYSAVYFDFSSQPTFINFSNHYNEIVDRYLKEKEEKEYYRSHRSHWEGGGFGVKGAITGALKAGAMNIVTDAFRGIGDSISDAFTASSFKRERISLISEAAFRDLEVAFDNCVLGMFLACQREYSEHKKIDIPWDTPENQNRAKAIFNNATTRATNADQVLKMISESIKLAPYNYEFYEFLYRNNICSKAEVNILAEHLGYSLRPVRLSLFMSQFEKTQERYYGENGLITKVYEDETIDPGIELLQTVAKYDYQYADEVIETGIKYGLFARTDRLILLVETIDSTPELSILAIALSAMLNGLYREATALILEEKYDSTTHAAFLVKLDEISQLYNCEKYALPQDKNDKDTIDQFTSGKILEGAIEESKVIDRLEQLDAITDDETISHEEKRRLILEFSKKIESECLVENCDSQGFDEVKKAITVALAWESLAQKYESKVEEEVLLPGNDIQKLSDGIRDQLFKEGIIDSKNSYLISDRFSVPYFSHFGGYHYSAYDYCNDMLITMKEMIAYFGEKRLCHDYEMREKIGTAIISVCQKEKNANRLNINRKLDPDFGKRELTYDKTKCWVANGNAQILRDDILYVCYHKVSWLSETFVGFAGKGIYLYKDQNKETELFPWSEIRDLRSDTYEFSITLQNGMYRTCEFGGLTWSATILAEQIWKIIKDAMQEINREETIYASDSRTFLSRRLECFLNEKEKESFYVGGYTDDDLISNVYCDCNEIEKIESDPYIALFITPNYMDKETVPVTETSDPFILVTNRNIFFRSANKIEYLPITNIKSFAWSTNTLWILVKNSKRSYPITLNGYDGSLEDLSAHLGKALIIEFA